MPDEALPDNKLVLAAEVAVRRLTRPTKILMVLVILVVSATVFGLYQQHQSDIRGCQNGNARAQSDNQNWDFFISILAKGDKKPADLAEVKYIEQHIATVDAPRDCGSAWF